MPVSKFVYLSIIEESTEKVYTYHRCIFHFNKSEYVGDLQSVIVLLLIVYNCVIGRSCQEHFPLWHNACIETYSFLFNVCFVYSCRAHVCHEQVRYTVRLLRRMHRGMWHVASVVQYSAGTTGAPLDATTIRKYNNNHKKNKPFFIELR